MGSLVWIVCAVGCKPEQRDDLTAKGQEALTSAGSAIKSACGSLAEEARKLNSHSSEEALRSARDRAGELVGKLSKIEAPSELERLRLDSLREQVSRLDSALTAQNLRRQWEAALKEANHGKEMAAKDLEEARRALRDKDGSFKALDDRLLEAERAYKNACNRLSEAMAKEDAVGKPKPL